MIERIAGVRILDDSGFATLTDRWGDEITDRTSCKENDGPAIERLSGAMRDEATFVVRRLSDGAYGLLLESYERPHSESEDDSRDVECPPKGQVLAELASEAARANDAFPGLDAWVESGPDVFSGRAVVRAFVPEGSPLSERVGEIVSALNESPAPPAP